MCFSLEGRDISDFFYGNEFTVECPTGSGVRMTLFEVAREIARRLTQTFLRDEHRRRPVYGATHKFQTDPNRQDLIVSLRVLPRRQRRRHRRQSPDRLDGAGGRAIQLLGSADAESCWRPAVPAPPCIARRCPLWRRPRAAARAEVGPRRVAVLARLRASPIGIVCVLAALAGAREARADVSASQVQAMAQEAVLLAKPAVALVTARVDAEVIGAVAMGGRRP